MPDHPEPETDGAGDDADVGSAGASADGVGAVADDLDETGAAMVEPPVDDPRPDGLRSAESLVVVNTGDGKGKSSAAFGIVMRSVARDWPVAVVQFLKSGSWQVGEEKVGRRLGVDWWALGEGFTWDSEDLTEDQAVAREAWRHASELLATGSHRLVVLDEITYPMNWGWIGTDEVVAAIAARSPKVNVVATGRDAPAALLDVADTATEMRVIKHAYDNGIVAKKGIDY
ncbi:MAG: cob(I)yrinic acid a,c-diamide adenosyltransferase [Acidimicrobiales bacterium]